MSSEAGKTKRRRGVMSLTRENFSAFVQQKTSWAFVLLEVKQL